MDMILWKKRTQLLLNAVAAVKSENDNNVYVMQRSEILSLLLLLLLLPLSDVM